MYGGNNSSYRYILKFSDLLLCTSIKLYGRRQRFQITTSSFIENRYERNGSDRQTLERSGLGVLIRSISNDRIISRSA